MNETGALMRNASCSKLSFESDCNPQGINLVVIICRFLKSGFPCNQVNRQCKQGFGRVQDTLDTKVLSFQHRLVANKV